jgi:hypothetical protein
MKHGADSTLTRRAFVVSSVAVPQMLLAVLAHAGLAPTKGFTQLSCPKFNLKPSGETPAP